MAQTLVNLLVHVVFSTKNRTKIIAPEIEPELFAYMAGTLKNLESPCLAINGTADHVHILVSQSKNVALSRLVGELKESSSRWIKTKSPKYQSFDWQDGYGAFSIGQSNVAALKKYIAQQKERHKKKSFQVELIEFLKRYGVKYDERYLWT
jgi:REP element-mobilizing transposase RayT